MEYNEICPFIEHCEAIHSSKSNTTERKKFNFRAAYNEHHVCASPIETGGIMVLGLYPGWQEVQQQENAVGSSGKILRSLFSKAILYHQQITGILKPTEAPYVFYSNVVRCQPRRGIDSKTVELAAVTCSYYTVREIEMQKPLVIVACGELAVKYFLKNKFSTIKTQRGKYTRKPDGTYMYNYNGIPVIPTWNTARAVRADKLSVGINVEAQVRNDIQEVIYAWKNELNRQSTKFIPASDII